MSEARPGLPRSKPLVARHPILDSIIGWVTGDREMLCEVFGWLDEGSEPLVLVKRLNARGVITDDQVQAIGRFWEPTGALGRICACFRDALEPLVADPDVRLSAWLVMGIVPETTAVQFRVGDEVYLLVMGPRIDLDGGGIMSKFHEGIDIAFLDELRELKRFLDVVVSGSGDSE